MKIVEVILLLSLLHVLISMFCCISTIGIGKKWYEKIYLLIPGLNFIWTLYTLDSEISLLKLDKSYFELKSQIHQRQIVELRNINKSPRKIKIGDGIVYPNNETVKNEVRGKIGVIVEINDEGVVAEIIDSDTYWTTSWDVIYGDNIVIIGNDVLKPFKFVN